MLEFSIIYPTPAEVSYYGIKTIMQANKSNKLSTLHLNLLVVPEQCVNKEISQQ